ncbi:MAG: tripartite tricarboxylate transporter substrate binding protein [Gemmatimonadetes bacterium]|nr:tripartite tricarboxylate transporter substrate binding protein [Gemmatimonadota bacterium]
MLVRIALGAIALAIATTLAIPGAVAKYPEKTITFIIPYKPGGGFDTYVRALAPIMEKRLGVTVVPKNIPGAGGRKGATYLYKSKPDGYRISIMNLPGKAIAAIQGKKGVGYDIRKFTWLGQIASDSYVIAVAGKSKIKSIADLKKLGRVIKTAGTGKGATSYVVSQIAANILGLKVKLVTGYKGSSGMSIAVIRGDTDIAFFAYRSYSKFAKSGDLRAIAALDEKGAAMLGKPGLSKLRIHRLVAAPPGLPSGIKKTLEDALFASINDAGFKKWAKKARRPLAALKGKASEKLIDELVMFYTGHKDKFK